MAWLDKPTIEAEGGIAAHVRNMGLNWDLFVELDDKKEPSTRIGRELAKEAGREKPLDGRTVSGWRSRRKQDM